MNKSDESQATPSPKVSGANNNPKGGEAKRPTAVFLMAAMDMTWQLALVVLIPIVGGYELDKRFNTTPLLIIIGFVLAMIGTFVIIKRTLAIYNDQTVTGSKADK